MGNKFGIEGEADLKMKYASCLRLINMNADQLKKKIELFLSCNSPDSLVKATTVRDILNVNTEEGMTIIDRFCEYDGKKVNIFEICSGLILVSDSSLKQKCELFVQLFDTNKNYMIGRNELIFLFRCCIRAISIFMQESKSPKTTEITSLVDELPKRDRRFSENGISTQDFLRFVLNTSIILEFLRNFGLFMSEEFAYNFGENKLRLMYHEYFEAEIKRLNTCYSKEYLKYRKGDRSLKDNLSSNVQKDFESLSNSIKRLEPKYGAKTKRKALKTFRPEREHVYGFRCYDIRDNIILNPNDKLFYTSGSMVISIDLNKEETQQIDNDGDIIFEVVPKEQKIFDNHSTSVQSFDMYVEENNTSSMIASCEGSAENNIIIWDSDTFEVKASLKNYFELGVSKVKFSNNCKFIAVIGRSAEDSQHLAVFNYSKIETFLKSGRKDDKLEFLLSIGSKPVSDMTFDHLDQSIYFTNGESLCKYKIYGDKGLQTLAWQSKLNRSGNANSEFLTCILCPPGRPVLTTTIKGSIYSWDAGFKEISGAHQSAINCFERIDYMQATYGTGSDDGLIKFWTPDLLLVYSIDLMLVYSQMPNTINPSVTHLKYRNGTLVFSTRGGYIYKSTLPPGFQAPDDLEESKYGDQKEKVTLSKHTEQNTVSSQISIVIESVAKGISDQYVTGAALSFISPEIYIIGTNNVLMHWNYKKKSLVKQKKIEYPTKLLTTSQNGNFIAIGCKNGSVLLLSATTFEILFTHSCEKREITSITFSTSNENLAIGYDNGVLEVLSTPMNFKMVMNIRNVNMDPITSLDFSEDNLYLRATFSDMNICLYDVSKYKIMTPPEYGKLAQESWGQWTSSVGYQVQGIWGEYDSELDILGANRSSNKDILAIWDKYGGVKLFRYPCLFFDDPFIRLSQTGGDTSIVLFNYNSTHMFVVGKNDSCIVQYKLNYDEFDPKYNDDNNYSSKVEKEKRNVETIRTKDKDRPDRYLKHLPLLYPSNFDHKEIISQSYTGLNFEMIESVGLNLENIKRPIVSVNEETLIYCSGTNLVRCSLPDQEKYKKKMYFHFHNKPISMIEVSKSRNLIATSEFIDILDGEADQTAKIIIHDFTKQEIISEMWMEKNESCIFAKFSPNEDILVAVTNKPGVGNRLIVLDWANALQIQSFPCGKATICELCFKNDSQFATVSTFQVIFWKLNGVKLEQKYGVYKDVEQEFDNTSATYAFEKSLFFTGHSKGTIGCWQNDELKSEVSGHQGKAVLLMRRHQNDTLFTAGADGVIVRWGYSTLLQRIGPVYEVRESSLREKMGFLSINPSLNDMIIITETGDIIRTGTKTLPKIIMSEVTAQISSICYIDTHRILIVSTYDGRVIEVSFTNKATGPIRQTINSGTFYTAMAYLSDIERIVVSDNKGMLYILKKALDGEESQLASSFTQPSNSVILLKPSPDLRKMIVGSNGGGGKIEVIRIESNRLKRDSIVNLGLAGGILSVDWDKDSAIIFVNTSEGEIKSYNILKGIFLKAVEIRDIEWSTFTSPFSFYAGGLHRNPDGTSDITSVCTRKGFPFIIAGTRNGEIFADVCPSILNTKRKDLIRPHIKAVDQIILSNYNDYMITKSTDSVFVWKLTARLENDMLAGTEKIMAEMVTISKRSDHFFGKQSNILGLVSEINIGGPKDPDSFLKFREARSSLWGLPRGVLEPKLIFNKSDLDKYKEDILLHSTSIRRSKPNVKPHYAGSNGIDTSESNPKIELSKDGSWLLTYCRGFPYIHNLIDDVQLRYEGHATQITSVSTHPSEFLVASSDTESNIHIWECKTGICLSKFKSPYAKGAVCLSFSDNERHLAGLFCVGTSYYIAIFDAHQGIMLSSVLIGSKSVRSIMYKKKLELVTIGKDHLSLWKLRNGMLFGETIPFGDCCSDLTCMALNKLDMVIGTSEGKISVLREQITEKKFNDDIKCRVTALSVSNLNIYVGYEDSTIKILSSTYLDIKQIKMMEINSSIIQPCISAISTCDNNQRIIVLMRSGELIDCTSRYNNKVSRIVKVSNTKEDGSFASLSEDGTLRIWDTDNENSNKVISFWETNHESGGLILEFEVSRDFNLSAFDFSVDDTIAIGSKTGLLRVDFR